MDCTVKIERVIIDGVEKYRCTCAGHTAYFDKQTEAAKFADKARENNGRDKQTRTV